MTACSCPQMQLRQAVLLAPQQVQELLKQQQQTQGVSKPPPQAAAIKAAAADSMDTDQPPLQESKSAPEVAAAIAKQHAEFLAKLSGPPS
jgi:hypothetical protein